MKENSGCQRNRGLGIPDRLNSVSRDVEASLTREFLPDALCVEENPASESTIGPLIEIDNRTTVGLDPLSLEWGSADLTLTEPLEQTPSPPSSSWRAMAGMVRMVGRRESQYERLLQYCVSGGDGSTAGQQTIYTQTSCCCLCTHDDISPRNSEHSPFVLLLHPDCHLNSSSKTARKLLLIRPFYTHSSSMATHESPPSPSFL